MINAPEEETDGKAPKRRGDNDSDGSPSSTVAEQMRAVQTIFAFNDELRRRDFRNTTPEEKEHEHEPKVHYRRPAKGRDIPELHFCMSKYPHGYCFFINSHPYNDSWHYNTPQPVALHKVPTLIDAYLERMSGLD